MRAREAGGRGGGRWWWCWGVGRYTHRSLATPVAIAGTTPMQNHPLSRASMGNYFLSVDYGVNFRTTRPDHFQRDTAPVRDIRRGRDRLRYRRRFTNKSRAGPSNGNSIMPRSRVPNFFVASALPAYSFCYGFLNQLDVQCGLKKFAEVLGIRCSTSWILFATRGVLNVRFLRTVGVYSR